MDVIKVAGLNRPIPISSIIWIEGKGNYSLIHRVHDRPYLVSDTLKHFEQQLPAFMRVHKKVLVNPSYVNRLEYYGRHNAHLVLANDSLLRVSRRRLKEVAFQLAVDRFPKPSTRFSRIYTPQQGHFVTVKNQIKSVIRQKM